MNPFAIDAPVRQTFTDEGVADALARWAADQRERQAWRDEDERTYRYRADLLEAAAERLRVRW